MASSYILMGNGIMARLQLVLTVFLSIHDYNISTQFNTLHAQMGVFYQDQEYHRNE
jgi:hypothetical protein